MPDATHDSDILLRAGDLEFAYPPIHAPLGFKSKAATPAVRGVSLFIRRGETLGLLGESGCGKSTLTALLCGDRKPDSGSIQIGDLPLAALTGGNRRPLAERLQVIMQDPLAAFDPRQTIGRQIQEALTIHRIAAPADRARRVERALAAVALPPSAAERYPHQLSGGQRQRMAIARALVVEPEILLCDEPVSALDVSIQAQVLNLFVELQRVRRVAILFISHDVRVIRHMAHRVAVMKDGRIVETGPSESVFDHPQSDYTRLLLSAVPKRRSGRSGQGGEESPDLGGYSAVAAAAH